jgi:hypothetical protein
LEGKGFNAIGRCVSKKWHLTETKFRIEFFFVEIEFFRKDTSDWV